MRKLTADSFIRALVHLKGRRGSPKLIVSDNGRIFKGVKVKAYCLTEGIQWRFNMAAEPWWGGFFKRLVRSVRKSLKKSLRNARLTHEEAMTSLIEVEGVLNSRPLTYVYDEIDEPLTPSHLIMGRRI